MNRYAGIALTWSAVFLIVMAILVDSPTLFFMATAVIVTISVARLQAWLAVRYLRFERYTTPAVQVGEPVNVEVVVWSERRLKRPLVRITDELPRRLVTKDRTPSLPIAPSYDQPIRTRYSFRPMRRGVYRWERLVARGTDALGLVSAEKTYATDPVELTVYPAPLPVHEDIQPLIGWGASDLDSGRSQGSGLEPRGVREFTHGDPIRYIHWRSSARRGKLMVKEFETGSGVTVKFILQRQQGTEIGNVETTTFEHMCSHALYLATDFIERGADVLFPLHESPDLARDHAEARKRAVREILTEVMPNSPSTLAADVFEARQSAREGDTFIIFLAVQDPALLDSIVAWNEAKVVCICYDPAEFAEKRLPDSILPASEPAYIGQLERAGAQVVILGRQEHIKS